MTHNPDNDTDAGHPLSPRTQPKRLVRDHADAFGPDIVETAIAILDVWTPVDHGVAPSSAAASAVYCAMLLADAGAHTQAEIADVFGVSPATITDHWNDALDAYGNATS